MPLQSEVGKTSQHTILTHNKCPIEECYENTKRVTIWQTKLGRADDT